MKGIFALILLFSAKAMIAQEAVIKGVVIDDDSKDLLEYATIKIFNVSDSSLAGGGVTNTKGVFELTTKPGGYYVQFEFISYEIKSLASFTLNEGEYRDLGTIRLIGSAANLTEIEVRAEKSQMQLTLDKRVFNVGKDLANTGGSAADVLDNVPSVAVDMDGNVSLRGNQNVQILIDGKPSGLIGIGNTGGLSQLPANMIDKVEVVTNPSAKYQASGMTGIVNIVLKKDKKKGLNGSVDITAGFPTNYGAAINLNYRKKDFNLFANYGVRYRQRPGNSWLYQEHYLNADTTEILNQVSERTRGGLSNSIRTGADYYFNKKNILTASFTYRISDEDNFNTIIYNDYINDYPDHFVGKTIRTDEEKEDEANLQYELNYEKKFDKKGQKWRTVAQYENSVQQEGSSLIESYFGADNNPLLGTNDALQRSSNIEGQERWLFRTDYTHPFGKDGRIEVGARSSIRTIKNDYLVEEFDDLEWVSLEGLSNNFVYNENIHALYAIVGNKKGKFSYQIGCRGEYTKVKTQLEQTTEQNDTAYFNPFPSVHLTYELPNDNAIQLSYSRRIWRPRFRMLNPFFTFSDSRNFFTGNPNLGPQLANSIELGHIKYWEKGSFTTSIYYRHTDNVVERIRTINPDGTTLTKPENLSTSDAFGFEFTYSTNPYKWIKIDGDFNFYRSIRDGRNVNPNLYVDTYTMFGRGTVRFMLPKDIDAQLRFNYRAPRETTQGSRKAMYYLDFGINKDILKKKGTLTLSVRDILNSRIRNYTTFGENFYSEGERQGRTRQMTLTLNYRLNQEKRRAKQRNGGGDVEEEF